MIIFRMVVLYDPKETTGPSEEERAASLKAAPECLPLFGETCSEKRNTQTRGKSTTYDAPMTYHKDFKKNHLNPVMLVLM